ncbi:MAG: hypothetical protein AB2L14_17395 [Candidatus Xenobiia bacterium LiM19]
MCSVGHCGNNHPQLHRINVNVFSSKTGFIENINAEWIITGPEQSGFETESEPDLMSLSSKKGLRLEKAVFKRQADRVSCKNQWAGQYLLLIKCPRPSTQAPPRSGCIQDYIGSFTDDAAFKLGNEI